MALAIKMEPSNLLNNIWIFLGGNAPTIIALCALLFTAWQFHISRKHNKISISPHISCFINRSEVHNKGLVLITLTNNGLGPAFITEFAMTIDGIKEDISSVEQSGAIFNKLLGDERTFRHNLLKFDTEDSIQVNQSVNLIKLELELAPKDSIDKIVQALKRLDVILKYRSLYGDKFELKSLYKNS